MFFTAEFRTRKLKGTALEIYADFLFMAYSSRFSCFCMSFTFQMFVKVAEILKVNTERFFVEMSTTML